MKTLKLSGLALLAAASTASWTCQAGTNVLQNISLQLTVYQQGAANTQGTKVSDVVSSYNTKSLITALQGITGQDFGVGAKLVQSTLFSNVTITNFSSNNLAIPDSNAWPLLIGGASFNFVGSNIAVISNNTFIVNGVSSVTTNVVQYFYNTNESVTIITNAGYETTFTPQTDSGGLVTNVTVVSQASGSTSLTEVLFTNVSSTIDVLYGKTNALYPVGSYFIFSTNSPQVVVETGKNLNTNSPGTPNLTSQTGVGISNLVINYFAAAGSQNLGINLEGFVKQSLKVDVLSARSHIVEDIFGASQTWDVIGSGYIGGNFSSNAPGIAVSNLVDGNLTVGYLTNTTPVVVQGTVTLSFLKNLAQ